MIVRWPGHVPEGRASGAPVGLVDMMPTLLGAAGVPIPSGVEGSDLGALLRGGESGAPAEQYINFPCMAGNFSLREWRGIVTRRHTYVCTREGPWMLFDDCADPFQLANLVGDPAQASVRDDLDARTRKWLQRTGDRFETSLEIADRYAPNHRNCVAPYFMNDTVKAGSRDPALRRYRNKGQGL